MLPTAVFGIHNNGINLAVELVILFLVVIWLALIFWTWADARRRIADPMLVGCATVASIFPYVGTIVYMIVRPPEYLDDVRERELEMQAAEARLAELGYHLCPHCDYEVEKDFLRCPHCMRKLKDPCPSCGKPLDPAWKVCPYCEAEIGAMPSSAQRRTRRRRESPSEVPVPSARRDGPADAAAGSRRESPGETTVAGARRESASENTFVSAPKRAAERATPGPVASGFEAPAERGGPATT
jgi:hypothetical protein